jgi:hypothetical protein
MAQGIGPEVKPQHHQQQQQKDWSLHQAPVVHTCNPRYSGGRDQEDRGSKPAGANSLQDPISK